MIPDGARTTAPSPSPSANVWTVIQARTGSTRRPGKVLAPFPGGPLMIDWVVRRATLIGPPVCLAIPDTDTQLARVCLWREWMYVTGPEEDVLARFLVAARTINADHVVRVTADCPFLDIEAARWTLQHHLEVGADITTYHLAEGRGVQVISRDGLEQAGQESAADQRHSPDIWLLEHGRVEYLKFSVDTEDELIVARRRAEGATT